MKKRPLTGVVLLFMLGIGLGAWVRGEAAWLPWAAVACAAAFFIAYRHRSSVALLALAVIAAGAQSYRAAVRTDGPRQLIHRLDPAAGVVTLRGVVVSDAAGRSSFVLNVHELRVADAWEPVEGRVWVFRRAGAGAADDDRDQLRYGDLIECSLALQPPRPQRNPGVFDFSRWLARQRIHLVGALGRYDVCRIEEREHGNPVRTLALRLRDRFDAALRAGLETEPRLAGVLGGVMLGERAEIPPDTYAAFQQAGAFHVFAISGLHVGLVTGVVLICLRLLRVPRRWSAVVAIPLLVLYVFASGARPGAVRALVMACVWLCGWVLVRPTDLVNTLAVAALVILAFDPTQLFDGGFVLSFTVVGALVVLTPQFEARLRQWLGPDPLLPEVLLAPWRRRLELPLLWFGRVVAASVAAWIGLVPLMAIYFNLFTPISVVANVVAVPLLGAVISLGLLSILSHGLWPWLAETFNNANYFLIAAMMNTVEWLGRWRGGHWYVQAPAPWLAVGYYAAVGAVAWGWVRRVAWRWPVMIGVPLLGIGAAWWLRDAPVARLTVLDLTQGSAIFVDLPGEQRDFLVGTGDDWGAARVVLPFLRSRGVDQLESVWITRGTKAHLGGLDELAAALPIRRVFHSGLASRSTYYHEWLAAAERDGRSVESLQAGVVRPLDHEVAVHVLHPPPGWRAPRSQDNSLVLLLEIGTVRVLLLSDAGETVEQRLLEQYPQLRAEIVIKGRHGQEPSGTDALLASVRPRVVVLASAARRGRRTQTDLDERLRQRGIELHRTDTAGAAIIRFERDGYSLQPWL